MNNISVKSGPLHFGAMTLLRGRGQDLSQLALNLNSGLADADTENQGGIALYPLEEWNYPGESLALNEHTDNAIFAVMVSGRNDVDLFERHFGKPETFQQSNNNAIQIRRQMRRQLLPLLELGNRPLTYVSARGPSNDVDLSDNKLSASDIQNPFSANPEARFISDVPEVATVNRFVSDRDFRKLQEYCRNAPGFKREYAMENDERQRLNAGYVFLKRDGAGRIGLDNGPSGSEKAVVFTNNALADSNIEKIMAKTAIRYFQSVQLLYPQLLFGDDRFLVDFFLTRYNVKSEKVALSMHSDSDGSLTTLSCPINDGYQQAKFHIKDKKSGEEYRHSQQMNEAIIFSDYDNTHGVGKMTGLRDVLTMNLKPNYMI